MSVITASTVTAAFLECTPSSINNAISTVTTTTFYTEYCVTLTAACPTSEWIATYTVRQECTGDQATWTAPAIPPHFVVTTVYCDVCEHKTHTITCPNAAATGEGVTIEGNGVTATVTMAPAAVKTNMSAAQPANGSGGAAGAANTNAGGAGGAGGAANTPVVTGISAGTNNAGSGAAATTGATFATAGAPQSLKKSLVLLAGFAVVAGQFLML